METSILDKDMKSDVCVLVCYSQVGEWWQVFEGSLWYQWYVVTMERPKKGHEKVEEREKRSIEKSLGVKSPNCLCNLFQVIYHLACVGTDTYNKRRDLSPSNALTGMHRRRL